MSPARVTVTFDPTAPRGMRWSGKSYSANGYPLHYVSLAFSRRSVERQMARYFKRLPGRKTYTYELKEKAA